MSNLNKFIMNSGITISHNGGNVIGWEKVTGKIGGLGCTILKYYYDKDGQLLYNRYADHTCAADRFGVSIDFSGIDVEAQAVLGRPLEEVLAQYENKPNYTFKEI